MRDDELSPAGERRNAEILADALRHAKGRRVRRRLRRGALTVCCIGLTSATIVWSAHRPRPESPQVVRNAPLPSAEPALQTPSSPEVVIVRIATDETLLARMRVPPQAPTWKRLSDDDLLRQLADAGRPAGLAYKGGRAEILWR